MTTHGNRQRTTATWCGLIVLALLGYGLARSRAPLAEAEEPREVVVSIIVTDEEEGPVTDARVSVRESDRRPEDAARTRTNDQGKAEQHLTPSRDFRWYMPCDAHKPLYEDFKKQQFGPFVDARRELSEKARNLVHKRWKGTRPGDPGMTGLRNAMLAKKNVIAELQTELQKALATVPISQENINEQTRKLKIASREYQDQSTRFNEYVRLVVGKGGEVEMYKAAKEKLFDTFSCVTGFQSLGKEKGKSAAVFQAMRRLNEDLRKCKKCQGAPQVCSAMWSEGQGLQDVSLRRDVREGLGNADCHEAVVEGKPEVCAARARFEAMQAAARSLYEWWLEDAKPKYPEVVLRELEPLVAKLQKGYATNWKTEQEAQAVINDLFVQHRELRDRLTNSVVDGVNFNGAQQVKDGTSFAIADAQWQVLGEAHAVVSLYWTMVISDHEYSLAYTFDQANPTVSSQVEDLITTHDYPVLEETWVYGDKLSKFWTKAPTELETQGPCCSGGNRSDVTVLVEKEGYLSAKAEVEFSTGPNQEVRVTLKRRKSDEVVGPKEPSFTPCDRPGWIHVTRVVKLSDKRGRAGEGTFTAEFWLQEKSPGKLSGEGKYVYNKLDPTGGGSKGDKSFSVEGTIDNDHVVVEGDGDMEVVGFGNRTTREAVVIWDFMRKFDGKMVNNVYTSGPGEPITKYNVVYVVSKTVIQRCTGEQPVPGVEFPGIVIERPSYPYSTQKFPVPGAPVKVTGQSTGRTPFTAEAVTDRVGSFFMKDVPAGSYSVSVSAANHDTLTEIHVVKSGMKPPLIKLATTGLPANEIAPITGKVEFNVLVRDAVNKDKPVAKATVALFDKNQIGLAFAANDYGRFDTFLTPGQYHYHASAPGYAAREEKFTAGGETTPTGAALQNFTIYLQPGGSYTPDEHEQAAAAKATEIELEGLTREIKVPLAPGDRLRLYSAHSSANPFVISLGEFDRGRLKLLSERTEPVAERTGAGGKPLLGAPTERRVYDFGVGDRAAGETRVVVELRRPWEKSPSIRYTLVIEIGKGNQPQRSDK